MAFDIRLLQRVHREPWKGRSTGATTALQFSPTLIEPHPIFVMNRDSDLSPEVFLLGTPTEVDRFLASRLSDESGTHPEAHVVVNWIRLLMARGNGFASHAAACHYWLYEHYPGYDHKEVFRPARGTPGALTRDANRRTPRSET